jgi:GntR family transcriptional regulator/MocR family aminotransferase
MADWKIAFDPERFRTASGAEPLFVRVAALISGEIQRGRLPRGSRLPGTRQLCASLGINRNTVVAAYEELVAEGWILTRPAGGTFVSDSLPEVKARHFAARGGSPRKRDSAGFDVSSLAPALAEHAPEGVTFSLWAGPDLRELPVAALGRAYRRALSARGRSNLDYRAASGEPGLRAALAKMVANTRGIAAAPENVLITRGTQMALDLLARLLIRPGDRVAVEEIGYPMAWNVLRLAGAELVFIPVDRDGLDVDALAAAARQAPLRAIYLTPHHQYPTMAVLSVGRRLRLLELAAELRIAILEDDYDHEFHYEGRPLLPLASADPAGVVVYLGTLAKILAPGLRLGFIAAPARLIAELERLRYVVDRQGDHVLEAAVAELIDDGELQRHTRRMRKLYQARRDALLEALQGQLGTALDLESPRGGMALWALGHPDIDVAAWRERCAARGLIFGSGDMYVATSLTRRKRRAYAQGLRLGFACYDERELQAAVRLMAKALGT